MDGFGFTIFANGDTLGMGELEAGRITKFFWAIFIFK
jgi:hypothetical protein